MNQLRIRPSADGQWYIVEVAANGEPLNTSETYTSRSSALRAARERAAFYITRPKIVVEKIEENTL